MKYSSSQQQHEHHIRQDRQRGRSERGSIMLVALVVLSSLLAMGGLAVLAVQRSSSAIAHERFQSIAMFSAESGVIAGMVYLRAEYDDTEKWSAQVTPNNDAPISPNQLPGNFAEPGQTDNPFSPELRGWYEVTILNNESDPDFALGTDSDASVILRAVGHGPNGSSVSIEVAVSGDALASNSARPCPGYAQRGIGSDGAGRNDCLTVIDSTNVETYTPTAP